jgi:hypothetical protein
MERESTQAAAKPYSANDPDVQRFIAYLVNSDQEIPELDSPKFHQEFMNWSSWGMNRDEVS